MHLIIGPLLLFISLLYKIFPPRNVNFIYGYRTVRSMKSQDTWVFANKMGANLMIAASLATCAVQLVFYFIGVDSEPNMAWSAGIMIILLLATVPIVEMSLKKHFDNNGNPLHN